MALKRTGSSASPAEHTLPQTLSYRLIQRRYHIHGVTANLLLGISILQIFKSDLPNWPQYPWLGHFSVPMTSVQGSISLINSSHFAGAASLLANGYFRVPSLSLANSHYIRSAFSLTPTFGQRLSQLVLRHDTCISCCWPAGE